MEESKKSPSALELLTRIQELEERLIPNISKLLMLLSGNRPTIHPDLQSPLQSHRLPAIGLPVHGETSGHGEMDDTHDATKLTETHYCKIVHSMGQAIHMWDCNRRIIFWSQAAESLYGYTAAEAYGRTPAELLTEVKDASAADYVLEQTAKGQIWAGEFPIKSKSGERFVIIVRVTPFIDENGRLVGAMCVSADSRPYDVIKEDLSVSVPTRIHVDHQKPRQDSLASKIFNVALKLKGKMKTGTDHDFAACDDSDDTFESEARTTRGDLGLYPFGVFYTTLNTANGHFRGTRPEGYGEEIEEKQHAILSSKARKWMGKRRSMWPWRKQKEMSFADDQLCEEEEEETNSSGRSSSSSSSNYKMEAASSGLWASTLDYYSSTSSTSSEEENSNSRESNAIINVQLEGETSVSSMDYEILWEDIIINYQIGQGSCANVYHAAWYGSDVCIKLFKHQEYYDDAIVQFKQEVSWVKRLHHPNILLFIGAVTSRQHLSIVTEFLPRGCLFQILQQNPTRLDWTLRLNMAMDIARGMKYLHRCNPPILHLDLKSSNVLVDKNWTVKVGDFGLSRIKKQIHLNVIKADKVTPQWMAPEILRNEDATEKSDVYSYGVILWEIFTEKIPWNDLNPTQVVAVVGFMNQRLEIPKDVDPLWSSLIESCWFSDPQSRPTFQEILHKLKDMQKKFAVERTLEMMTIDEGGGAK